MAEQTPQIAPVADVTATPIADLATHFSTVASQPSAPVVTTSAPGTPATDTQPVVAPAAAAAPVSSYAVQAAELGIQLPATATDGEVFAALQGRLKELAPLAGYAQSLLPYSEDIHKFFDQRGQPATPAPAADEWNIDKHFESQWNAPKLTPDMQFALQNGMVQRDADTGLMVAKPGFEVMVTPLLSGMNQAINWERESVRDLFAGNPFKKTYDAIRDPIERLVAQKVEEQLAAVRTQDVAANTISSFEHKNAEFLYQKSATGETMLTPQGSQFVNLVTQLKDSWTGDTATLLQVCRAAVGNTSAQAPLAEPPAPTPAAAPAAKHPTPDKRQSFLDTALRQASATGKEDSGPVVVTPGELQNFFSNALSRASA